MEFFTGNLNCSIFSRKKLWTFKVKWAEQVVVKLMRPNWIFHSFVASLSSLSPTCWKGLDPVRSHLQGGFYPGHSLSPPLVAGWELAHPTLLPGARSCALLVAELWLLKPTCPGAIPASLEPPGLASARGPYLCQSYQSPSSDNGW